MIPSPHRPPPYENTKVRHDVVWTAQRPHPHPPPIKIQSTRKLLHKYRNWFPCPYHAQRQSKSTHQIRSNTVQTNSVTTPAIQDTFVSVHYITKKGTDVNFTHRHAWLAEKSQLNSVSQNFKNISTWKQHAFCIPQTQLAKQNTCNPKLNHTITAQKKHCSTDQTNQDQRNTCNPVLHHRYASTPPDNDPLQHIFPILHHHR